jgi:ATP-binding cassette, subfamily B, bacterial PglK
MWESFKKIRDVLPSLERRQAVWLFAMMTVMALLDTLGVVSIVPFMMVVSKPDVLQGHGWLARLFAASGIDSENRFLFLLGFGVLLVLVAGNVFKAVTAWRINRFTYLSGHAVSVRLIRVYFSQSYDYFLTRHTVVLGKNVLSEVEQVVNGVIQPGLVVLARLVVAAFLVALLVAIDPLLALFVVVVLGGIYGAIYGATRLYLSRSGQERFKANRERYHVSSEAFSGIKEVKLGGLETAYVERFAEPSLHYAQLQAASRTLASVPRYGLEVLAFGGILLIVLYLLTVRQGLEDALPLIALYAFAGYRMLPTMQEIFAGVARVRFTKPALDLLHRDIMEKSSSELPPWPAAALPFKRAIRLANVDYCYPAGDRPVLQNIDLEIPRGVRVAFIGPTGAGKSTVVDLILGLLQPTAGTISVDDQLLQSVDIIRRWQRQIGYVPQHIFLTDDTVTANIAFGESPEAIDHAAVQRAAHLAQLHEFIVDELPQGYDTKVGERGVRLSGGQRQRLGLARALYGDPSVLVLDEATSALDTTTEDAVIEALDSLDGNHTVILIAHRLSTVRNCDILYKLEQGRLVACGSHNEVLGIREIAHG